MSKSGVYRIDCGDCNMSYIGQTRRSFAIRKQEHLKYPEKSNFCSHLRNFYHDPIKASF